MNRSLLPVLQLRSPYLIVSANFATWFYGALNCGYSQCAVCIQSAQDHTLALAAQNLTRGKVGNEAYLLAYQILRIVVVCNAGEDGTATKSVINPELEQLVRLGHLDALKHCTYADIQLLKLGELDVLLMGLAG